LPAGVGGVAGRGRRVSGPVCSLPARVAGLSARVGGLPARGYPAGADLLAALASSAV
jgi:hypothetical protein